jgi:acyl carrier protein
MSALHATTSLTGLLHAAGVAQDTLLRSMSLKEVHSVADPKAVAASQLCAAAARAPLEALGFFSSITSTFGNIGQANYAAANAHLDALALCRRYHGTLASSLQIPAVRGVGMGARAFSDEQLRALGAISLETFSTCLAIALMPSRGALERTQVPLARVNFEHVATPTVSELTASSNEGGIQSQNLVSGPGSALAQFLHGMSSPDQHKYIEELGLRVLRELVGTSSSLTTDTQLSDLGIDSIAALELSSQLRSVTGVQLSPTEIFDQPTTGALAAYLLRQTIDADEDAHDQTARSTTNVTSGTNIVAGSWPGGGEAQQLLE